MQERNARGFGRIVRGASRLGLVASAVLLVASGCSDEVGGDGFVPDRPSAGKGGLGGGAGTLGEGGLPADGGASGESTVSGGKAGSTNHAGTSGKGGRGGSSTMTDGGMGGESTGTSVCGNNATEPGEECDDGNTKSGDGCTADCKSACEVCEKTYCKAVRSVEAGDHGWVTTDTRKPPDLHTSCFEMPDVAKGGPAQGVARSELCQELVDCVRREQCAQQVLDNGGTGRPYRFLRCFCDRDVGEAGYVTKCADPAQFVPGKCRREFQEASERDDVAGVFNGIPTSVANPSNMALVLMQGCDRKLCAEECVPQATVGVVATISADILWQRNAAGESPLGNLIADAERASMATDFALLRFDEGEFFFQSFFGSAGLRFGATPGRPADADGRVLESELWHVVFGMDQSPVANYQALGQRLVTLKLTGQKVYDFVDANRDKLHISGLTFTWDGATSHVTEIKKDGTLLDKSATYSVTVNNEMTSFVAGATDIVTTDKDPEREIVAYLKAQPQPIAPPTLNRIVRAN